jgi:hypothetical protein
MPLTWSGLPVEKSLCGGPRKGNLCEPWKAGRLAREQEADLCVWASGELAGNGTLKPIESISHKLRIFVEFCRCHSCRSIFIAPAANRSTTDLRGFHGGYKIEELLFDPDNLPRLPADGTPAIVWVNNPDVMALLRWLIPESIRISKTGGRIFGVKLISAMSVTNGPAARIPTPRFSAICTATRNCRPHSPVAN